MNEAEWLEWTDEKLISDPTAVLRRLAGRISDRKLRLLACSCCRLLWPMLTEERSRTAVATSERYADAAASEEELSTAESEARTAAQEATTVAIQANAVWAEIERKAAQAAAATATPVAGDAPGSVLAWVEDAIMTVPYSEGRRSLRTEHQQLR